MNRLVSKAYGTMFTTRDSAIAEARNTRQQWHITLEVK